jgi:hypothetical protein
MAGEEASTLGRLTILQARMNPDLAMGDELLKKTGSGNLFMVFGEPDIEIKPSDDGRLTLEIHGLDVYDPTTGHVRSSSVDDIAAVPRHRLRRRCLLRPPHLLHRHRKLNGSVLKFCRDDGDGIDRLYLVVSSHGVDLPRHSSGGNCRRPPTPTFIRSNLCR